MNNIHKYTIIGIIALVALYIALRIISAPLANFLLITFIIFAVPILGAIFFLKEKLFEWSIYLAKPEYRKSKTMLQNNYCIVTYSPNSQIIVSDNNDADSKRMFAIAMNNTNVNVMWFRICRQFDVVTNLNSLAAFCKKYTLVTIITQESPNSKKKSVRDGGYGIDASRVQKKVVQPVQKQPEVEDTTNASFEELMQRRNGIEHKNAIEVETVDIQEMFSMDEIEDAKQEIAGKKININTATAEEISVLPGLNIVGAKKLVEYRNLNGGFSSMRELLTIMPVKEHFVPQIENMITFEASSPSTNNNNQDRQVDI